MTLCAWLARPLVDITVCVTSYLWNLANLPPRFSVNHTTICAHLWAFHRIIAESLHGISTSIRCPQNIPPRLKFATEWLKENTLRFMQSSPAMGGCYLGYRYRFQNGFGSDEWRFFLPMPALCISNVVHCNFLLASLRKGMILLCDYI